MSMDLYPLKATVGGRLERNLRLRSDRAGTVVWRLDRATGAVIELVRTDAAPERVGATQSWRVSDLELHQQRGCGCNHPMYAWFPPDDTAVG